MVRCRPYALAPDATRHTSATAAPPYMSVFPEAAPVAAATDRAHAEDTAHASGIAARGVFMSMPANAPLETMSVPYAKQFKHAPRPWRQAMRLSVEGNIGSGKSDALKALATAFPAVPVFPEPVEQWAELLDLYYASPAEWSLPFSLKVLLSFREPARADTCIVERSPLASRHVFSQVLYNESLLNQQEWDLFKEYHDVLAWKPGVIFYIDTPADVCMERIRSRGRACEAGITLEYLSKVDFQYGNMLRFAGVPTVRFDGTLPPAELHAAIVAEARTYLG